MRTITLPTSVTHNAKEVLKTVMERAPSGMDLGEMRKRIKIIDAIEAAEGADLALEDAEYDLLKSVLAAHRWPFAHKDFITLVDSVNAASAPSPH